MPKRSPPPKKPDTTPYDEDATRIVPGQADDDATQVFLEQSDAEATQVFPAQDDGDTTRAFGGGPFDEDATRAFPGQDDEDVTRIVPGQHDEDVTRIVPGQEDEDATRIVPGQGDDDATQIVPGQVDPNATQRVRGEPAAADDESTEMVSRGATAPEDHPALDPFEGRHPESIGHFRILKTLGEGGMGAVYLAEQSEPFERTVALKVIHASLRSHDALVRFEAERQAMARLSHPNVAALHEAGATPDGFPYFAMEQVPGEELHRYCDKKKLSVEGRLRLFIDVCAGVQHAHQKGILHRDLKPANVLVTEVDGRPVPKIIDFGIAKAVDEPLTEAAELTGQRAIGTPAYMSPEALAASQDLDTRTDVFSLGVVLYELLLGTKPGAPLKPERKSTQPTGPTWAPSVRPLTRLTKGDSTQLSLIARRRSQSLSELKSAIKGDIDWILMKSLAEERDHRYDSVAEFAADVERHLAFEPVLAGPPSVRYRVGRFVRRHRVGVAAGLLVLLTLIGGIVGTTVGLLRARAAEAEARLEADRAEQVAGFMTELFRVSDPGEARGNSITARELLDKGAARIDRELAEQPILRARLMGTMGNVYGNLGLYEQAVGLAEKNLAVQETELGPDHPDVAASMTRLGNLYRLQSRFDEAEGLLRRAVSSFAVQPDPEVAARADALVALAAVLVYQGEVEESEATYREAVAILEGAVPPAPAALGEAYHHLGWFLGSLGRWDESIEAIETLGRAVSLRRQAFGDDHFEVADSLLLLGSIERNIGEFDAAEGHMTDGLAVQQRVLEPDHPDIGQTYLDLGSLYRFQGQPETAAEYFDRAEALFRTSLGDDHLEVARVLQESAINATDLGDWAGAEAQLREQLSILRRDLGEDHEMTGMALNNLGWVLSDGLRRYPEGEAVLLDAVAVFDAVEPENDYWQGLTRWSLANNLRDQERFDDARTVYEEALAELAAAGGASRVDNPDLGQLVDDYGTMLERAGLGAEVSALEARFGQQ
ncbi:MAG: serine/threonine-protein kinase [Pseudomonadota bacterium]